MRHFEKISKLDSLSNAISEFAKKKRERENVEPSQPAGAREWLPKQPIINYLLEMYNGRFAKDIVAAMEGYARQQTAAKDGEIKRLTHERDDWQLSANLSKKERIAAERERDSLREVVKRALDMKQHGAGNEFWDEWEINAAAALKAGKDER